MGEAHAAPMEKEVSDFTQQVMKAVEVDGTVELNSMEKQSSLQFKERENQEVSSSQNSERVKRLKSSAIKLVDRRMIVAYGIQLAVIRELKSDEEFLHVSIEDLPQRVAEVTRKVCEEYNFQELLG